MTTTMGTSTIAVATTCKAHGIKPLLPSPNVCHRAVLLLTASGSILLINPVRTTLEPTLRATGVMELTSLV